MLRSDPDAIVEAALDWRRAGKSVALATVVETWGSAPRPVGAQMAVNADAEMVGSVSGGCVESAVVSEALDAIEDGAPRLLKYGVSNEDAFAVGLACGGVIRVLVEPVGVGAGPSDDMIESLAAARASRRPAVYAVRTSDWARQLILNQDDPLWETAAPNVHADRSGFEGDWFFGVHNPPLRLAIVGAVHIAQALAPMARIAGYDILVIDPREAFGSAARFPDMALSHEWPDEALEQYELDSRTAVVTLTHDPKMDDPAIRAALASDAFYIGSLGSKRTHGKRLDRLQSEGVSQEALTRIHAPIGADIGAKSPAEIAVSILAELTERLRRPETRP